MNARAANISRPRGAGIMRALSVPAFASDILSSYAARSRPLASRLEDPRGGQRRHGPPRLLAFWFGEPDEVTPGVHPPGRHRRRWTRGETFYTHNLGMPELREALAAYVTAAAPAHGTRTEIAVTSSGLSALMLATQALVGPGDRVVEVTPLWPNLVEIPKILGAEVDCVALDFRPRRAGRSTSTACSPPSRRARARSTSIRRTIPPAGPSTRRAARDPRALPPARHLDLRRRRLRAAVLRERRTAPLRAFVPRSSPTPDDRVVSTNTFSKIWLMTGWRLGWIVAPAAADRRPRQADRVQHLLRAGVRAARRRGRGDARASR